MNNKIISRSENFADWYSSVINAADLIQYIDIKGSMIFKPYAWSIWENIKKYFDVEFSKMNIQNMYVPLLISMDDFQKEKEHVEGFAPELYLVTAIGKKQLDTPLAIRPTSEILFCKYFKNNINSYKDLPIKVNQWTSVLRAEKNTKPFLRNVEFHWHEAHCMFSDLEQADKFALDILNLYEKFCQEELCIPVIKGLKTKGETFAGADHSYTIESMMQDGQALQSATSHVLGQSFCKTYDIKFQNNNNELCYPFYTSHAITTRIIGALIMVHGDDKGIILPPSIAPIQIKIIPLFANKNSDVIKYANQIKEILKNKYRCDIDLSNKSFGYSQSESETKGIPISIIVGPNDIKNSTFTLIRRDDGIKQEFFINDLNEVIESQIQILKSNLYNNAYSKLMKSIKIANNIDELKNIIENKMWAKVFFNGDINDEIKIKELTGATPRCIIQNLDNIKGKCIITNKETNQIVLFARAY